MPYKNEHAARINDPDKYSKIRRENDKFGSGIHVLWGVLPSGKTEVQAVRFDSDKFTPAEAKKWLKDHDYSVSEFEEASGKSMESEGLEYKTFRFNIESLNEIKSSTNTVGLIKGYASTFGNTDLGNDVVERGAFLKTIDKYQKAGDKIPICFQHSLMHIVGGCDPSKMHEDNNGLHIEGEIYKKTSLGSDVYELAKQGVLNKMSIGYSVDDCDYNTAESPSATVRRLKELSLYEISMVAHPMNPSARITDVKMEKSLQSVSVKEFITILSDREIPLNEKKSLVSQILRRNVLSRNAADFIMSFIFKDTKQHLIINDTVSEVTNIFSDLLTKQRQELTEREYSSVKNELQKLIR